MQRKEEHGCFNMPVAECDAPAVREATAIWNWWAVYVARDALPHDISTANCCTSRMEGPLINLWIEVDGCFGALDLCASTIRSATYSRLGPFMSTINEACNEKLMSLRGNNDCNVGKGMGAVHGQPLCRRGIVDAVRARTYLASVTGLLESDSGVLNHAAPPTMRLNIPLFH